MVGMSSARMIRAEIGTVYPNTESQFEYPTHTAASSTIIECTQFRTAACTVLGDGSKTATTHRRPIMMAIAAHKKYQPKTETASDGRYPVKNGTAASIPIPARSTINPEMR